MKHAVENIRVKDLDELPYVVTVPIRVHIDAAKKAIVSSNVGMYVVVVRVGEKLYPIDNMAVLAAYVENGNAVVPCTVDHVETLAEAQMRHIHLSTNSAINPFVAGEAVEYVKARDESMIAGTEDRDYTKISRLKLAPGVREMMSEYITNLGKRTEHIPSFYNMLKGLSKYNQGVHMKALGKLLSYCDTMAKNSGHYALPMPDILMNILSQYDTGKRICKYPLKEPTRTYSDDESEEDGNGSKKDKSRNEMTAKESDDMPGYYHNMDPNNVDFTCECGLEYVINRKNLTVRKREEQEKMVLLKGDYGDPMYAIRNDAADYLDLPLQPSIYYYPTSKKPHGSTVILSRNKITDGTLRKIRAVLEE